MTSKAARSAASATAPEVPAGPTAHRAPNTITTTTSSSSSSSRDVRRESHPPSSLSFTSNATATTTAAKASNTGKTLRLPERFKDEDDAEEDVTAPKTRRGRYMNQSLISVIASAGTNTNFSFRHGPDQLGGAAAGNNNPTQSGRHHRHIGNGRLFLSQVAESRDRAPQNQHRPQPPALTAATIASDNPLSDCDSSEGDGEGESDSSPQDNMTSSQFLIPRASPPRHADVVPHAIVEEGEEFKNIGSTEGRQIGSIANPKASARLASHSNLIERLAHVFGINAMEEDLVATYPCWLLQSVMLQGHMYITSKYMLFYAYLPNRLNSVSKSGYLAKRGRQNPKYHRYWFVLKGDVLSYYQDPSILYFPRDTIDMRSAISAELLGPSKGEEESAAFKITSALDRVYYFRADSPGNATQWVKQLQRTIFRIRNEGDSVKISIPINNILDIDDYPFSDFADTFRVKVVDNDESYAIDEYFFAFFDGGERALATLRKTVESSLGRQNAAALLATINRHEKGIPGQSDHLLGAGARKSSDSSGRPSNESSRPGSASSVTRPRGTVSERKALTAKNDIATDSQDSQKPRTSGLVSSSSFSRLPEFFKATTFQLPKAVSLASGLLKDQSKRMGSVLASESFGYYERVSTMWAGKRTHYDYSDPTPSDEFLIEAKEEDKDDNHNERFRMHFALPESERLHATFYAHLNRMVPVYGKIYVGTRKVCFRGLLPGSRTKMILPMREIENVNQEKGFRFGYSGLVIVVRGHEELFFEFASVEARDDCAITLLHSIESGDNLGDSMILSPEENLLQEAAKAENDMIQPGDNEGLSTEGLKLNRSGLGGSDALPIVFDDPLASILSFKPSKPLKVTCLTVGSRGDVQPYIALAKGLMEDGHSVRIATHAEFGPWIQHHGIDFFPIAGDPAVIMQLCVENDMFTVAFLREAHSKFRGWIEDLLHSAWDACQGSDLLIESPSAMAGVHIAEALEIPYFRAFTMPWTRTRAYPHAFTVPSQKLGGNYNSLSYVMFDNIFWQAIAGQVNRWRAKTLGLPGTNLDQMQTNKIPFLYNFSPSVVVPPLDFSSWVRITGYWFLDEGNDYVPPKELSAFIQKARKDKKKLVYVGFGSVTVEDPAALTRIVVESVEKADVRCILSKGWSDRLDNPDASKPEVPLPPSIHQIKSAPHDWLFRQIDAAAHHGGAGTTGASLRAGIPTVVKPFFGDQFFFGARVEDLGVGKLIRKVNRSVLARALWEVTNNERIISRAKLLGERIRNESGVQTAIEAIYRDLDYAKSLVKRRKKVDKAVEEAEESWTLVENDNDDEVDNDDDDEVDYRQLALTQDAENPEFHSTLQQRRQQQQQQRQRQRQRQRHHLSDAAIAKTTTDRDEAATAAGRDREQEKEISAASGEESESVPSVTE